MKSFLHILQILMSLGLGILYPFWLTYKGSADTWYGWLFTTSILESYYAIIMVGVAIYGSLFGGIYYEYLRRKRKKK